MANKATPSARSTRGAAKPKAAASNRAAKAAAPKVATADPAAEPAHTILQHGNGAEATLESAAAPSGEAEAKASDAGPRLVVTGPKGGRWRAGIHFGPVPVALPRDEFLPAEGAPDVRSLERLLAIVTDPHLNCVEENIAGDQRPVEIEDVDGLREALEHARASATNGD